MPRKRPKPPETQPQTRTEPPITNPIRQMHPALLKNKNLKRPITASRASWETTTIYITKEIKERLDTFRRPGESYNSAIARLVTGEADIRFEFLSIDDENPTRHSALFRLGEGFYYQWANGDIKLIPANKIKVSVSA